MAVVIAERGAYHSVIVPTRLGTIPWEGLHQVAQTPSTFRRGNWIGADSQMSNSHANFLYPFPVEVIVSLSDKIRDVIEMKRPNERILYYWQPFLERNKGFLLVTQERLIFYRPGGLVRKEETVIDAYLEDLTNIEEIKIRSGIKRLQINDAKNQYQFEIDNPDAVASLLRHLRWARIGYKSGYLERHGFEEELVAACLEDMLNGKLENAVRHACSLLETRIRDEIAIIATPSDVGQALINKAFNVRDGPLAFGKTDAEKEGLISLYRGAFLMFRNPVAHRYGYLDYSQDEAFEIISFVDLLLKILKRGVRLKREGRI